MPRALEGKTVLITGAAGGIGRATAEVCGEQGASLVLADREPPQELVAQLQAKGVPARAIAFDVTDRAAAEAAVADIGRLDALVANAGYCPWDDWHEAGWDEVFHHVIDVNLLGLMHLTRAVLAKMSAQGAGRMVLVSSVAARMGGLAASPHYVAAKGGTQAFVKWLARKAADSAVTVNSVAPGVTETGMTRGQAFDANRIPLRRIARPREIALPIAFLCSDGASYICGATLDVNGGVYMN
ncbi:SDR family oxidoreductase [Achromobacter sp. ACM02]|uniref:SDR family NAD(P)-dependent oxidoreductase n=1 Tax=Achromobacter sp. ACM02 TaxID=2769305 RepID=UPI001786FEDB|nr:SDR family NAD(P)-dependent oxidoreductase [Achromobacter sp. ACM02]MBD9383454.1 SDR family oxidoreductase [Achromobacter sp. ACM02]